MSDADRKAALRAGTLRARAALSADRRAVATDAATRRSVEWLASRPGVVALYAAFRDELDTGALATLLVAAGRKLALPVTPPGLRSLLFRAWTPGEALVTSRFSIAEPTPDAPEIEPDVLVVAPVAFDRRGYRVGYGAGFYDRTIPALRARRPLATLGLAFACQEVEAVPDEQHDVALDAIVTEREVIWPVPTIPGLR